MTVMTVEAREMSIGGHRPLVGCLLVVVVVGDKRRSEELIRWLVAGGCSSTLPVCKTAVFLLSCRAVGWAVRGGCEGSVRRPLT